MNGRGNMLTTLTLGLTGFVLYCKYKEQIRPVTVKIARAGIIAGESTKNLVSDLLQETSKMKSSSKGKVQNMFKRMDLDDYKNEKEQLSQSITEMKNQLSELSTKIETIKNEV